MRYVNVHIYKLCIVYNIIHIYEKISKNHTNICSISPCILYHIPSKIQPHTCCIPTSTLNGCETRLVEHLDLVQSKALQMSQVKPAKACREMLRNSASWQKMLRDAICSWSFFLFVETFRGSFSPWGLAMEFQNHQTKVIWIGCIYDICAVLCTHLLCLMKHMGKRGGGSF